MRRSIAVVAAMVALSFGLIASQPATADGGHKPSYKYAQGNGHGYGHNNGHGTDRGPRYARVYRRPPHWGRHDGYRRRGDGDNFLAAVGIIAGAKVAAAYLQGPPVQQTTVIYAAPPPRPCYQVMVPVTDPYGRVYYAPQLQCY